MDEQLNCSINVNYFKENILHPTFTTQIKSNDRNKETDGNNLSESLMSSVKHRLGGNRREVLVS